MKMRRMVWERAAALTLAAVMAFSPISYSGAFAEETELEESITEAPAAESLPEEVSQEPAEEVYDPAEEIPEQEPEETFEDIPQEEPDYVQEEIPQDESVLYIDEPSQEETQAPAVETWTEETPSQAATEAQPQEQSQETPAGSDTEAGNETEAPAEPGTEAQTEAQTLEMEEDDHITGSAGIWNVTAYMSDGSEFAQGSTVKVERIKDIIKESLLADGFEKDTESWKKEKDERTSALKKEFRDAEDVALWEAYQNESGADETAREAYLESRNASEIFDKTIKITATDADGKEYPKEAVDFLVSVDNEELYKKMSENGSIKADVISYEQIDKEDGTKEYKGTKADEEHLMYGDLLMDEKVSFMVPRASSGFFSFSVYNPGTEAGEEAVSDEDAVEENKMASENGSENQGWVEEAPEDGTASVIAKEDVSSLKMTADDAVVTVEMADESMIPAGSKLSAEKISDDGYTGQALGAIWEKYASDNGLDVSNDYYKEAFEAQKAQASDFASSYLITLSDPEGNAVQSGMVVTAEFKNDDLYSKTVHNGEKYELVTFSSEDGNLPEAAKPLLRDTGAFTYGYFAEDGMACIRLEGAGSGLYSVFASNPSWAFEAPSEEELPAEETEAETEAVTEAETETETEEPEDLNYITAQADGVTVTVRRADGSEFPEGTVLEVLDEKDMDGEDINKAKEAVSMKWSDDLRLSIDYMRFLWDETTSEQAAEFYREETSGMKTMRVSLKDRDGNAIDEDVKTTFTFKAGTETGKDAFTDKLDIYRLADDFTQAEADYKAETKKDNGFAKVMVEGDANRVFVFAGYVERQDFGVTEYDVAEGEDLDDVDILDDIREYQEAEKSAGIPDSTQNVINAGLPDFGEGYTEEELDTLINNPHADDNIARIPEDEDVGDETEAPSASEAEETEEETPAASVETEASTRTKSSPEEEVPAEETASSEEEMQDTDTEAEEEEEGFAVADQKKAATAAFDDYLETDSFDVVNARRFLLKSYGWSKTNNNAGTGNYKVKINGRYYEAYCIEPRVSGGVHSKENKKIIKPQRSTTSQKQIQFRKVLFYCAPKERGLNGEIKKGDYWKAHSGYSYGEKVLLNHYALSYINGKKITGNYFNAVNKKCAKLCYKLIDWCDAKPDPISRKYLYFYLIKSGEDSVQDSVTMTCRAETPEKSPGPYKRVSNTNSNATLGKSGTTSNDLGLPGTQYYYRISQPVGEQPDTVEVKSVTFADTLPQGVKIDTSSWKVKSSSGKDLTGSFKLTTGTSGIRQTISVKSTKSLGTGYSEKTIYLNFKVTLSRDDIYDHADNVSSKYVAGNGRIDYTVYNSAKTTIALIAGGKTVNGGGTTNKVTTTAASIGKYPSVSKGVHAGTVPSGAWLLSDWTNTPNDEFQYLLRVSIPKNDRAFMMKTLRVTDTLPHGIDATGKIAVYNNQWKNISSQYTSVISTEDNKDNQTITVTRSMTASNRIDAADTEIWIVVDCEWDRTECAKYKRKKNTINPDGSINVYYGPDKNNEGTDGKVLNHFQLVCTYSNMTDARLTSNDVRIQTKVIVPSANTKHIEPSVEKYIKAKESDTQWKLITQTPTPGENFRYKLVVDTRQANIPDTTSDATNHTLTADDLSKLRDCFNQDIKLNLTSGSITVPEYATLNGRLIRITGIADNTFKNKTAITRVTLPDSVQSIGASAFEGCGNLKTVNIPSKLTSLGARAFYGCSQLSPTGIMYIPGAVRTIKAGTFHGCQDFTIALCSGITTVEAGAFENTKWMILQVADGCSMNNAALRGGIDNTVVFHTTTDMSTFTGGGTGTEAASGNTDVQETYSSMSITDELPKGCQYVSTVNGGGFSVSCSDGRNLTASSSSIQAGRIYEIEIECRWDPDGCRSAGSLRFDKDDKTYYYGALYNNFMLNYQKRSTVGTTTSNIADSKKSNTVAITTKEFQPVQTEPQKWIDMDGAIATRNDLDTLKVIHDLNDPADNTVTFVIRQEIPRTYMWSLRNIQFYDPVINKLDIKEISFSYNSNTANPQYGTWRESAGEFSTSTVPKAIEGKPWGLRVTTQNTVDVINLSGLSGDLNAKIGVTAELRIVSSIDSARNALDGTYYWEWESDPDLAKGDHAFWTMRDNGGNKKAVARIPNRARTTVTYQCPDDYPYTEFENETQTVWVETDLPTADLKLTKKNQYDENVLNATFAVFEWNGTSYDESNPVAYLKYDEETGKYVLPENVLLKRDGYNQGKFKVAEIIAPDGYDAPVNQDRTPFSGEMTIEPDGTALQEINFDIYEEYLGMNIEILKIIDGTDSGGSEGTPLQGAEFAIYAKEDITTPEGHVIYTSDGEPLETGLRTGADGKAVSTKKYYPGKYIIYETEPPRDPVTGKPYKVCEPQEFEIVASDGMCVMLWGGIENNFVTQLSGENNKTINLDLSNATDYVDYDFTADNFLGSLVSTVPMKYRLTVDLNQPLDQALKVKLVDETGTVLSTVWMENGSPRTSGSVTTNVMYAGSTPRIVYQSDSFLFSGTGTKLQHAYKLRLEGDEAHEYLDYGIQDQDKQAYNVKISIDGSITGVGGGVAKVANELTPILFPVVQKYVNHADENDWKIYTIRDGKTEYDREVLYKLHTTFYKNDPDKVTQSAVISDTIPDGLNFTGQWEAVMGGNDVTPNLTLETDGQKITISTKTAEFAESLEGNGELYSENYLDIIFHCVWNREEYDKDLFEGHLSGENPYRYTETYGPVDNKYSLYTTYLSGEDHTTESNIVKAEIHEDYELNPTMEKWILNGSEKLVDRSFDEWDAIIPYRVELDMTDGDWTGRFTPTLIRIMDVYEDGLTYAKTDDTFAVEVDGQIVSTWSYDEIVNPADPDAPTIKNGWDIALNGNTMYVSTSDPDAIQGAVNKQIAVLTKMTLSENEAKLEKYWTDETHLTVPNEASSVIGFEPGDEGETGGDDSLLSTPPDIEMTTQVVTANFEIDTVNLEIYKTDAITGDKIKDAEFTIYEWNTALGDAGEYDTRTVDEGGKEPVIMSYDERKGCYVVASGKKLYVRSTNLGKFKAVETKIPEGYKGPVEKEFTKDEAVERLVKLNLVNEMPSVKVNLQKFDSINGTTPVQGAVYELRPDEIIKTPSGKTVRIPLPGGGTLDYIAGETIDTLTTDEDGKAVSTVDLYPGKYILQETEAPVPYKINEEPVRFSVVVDDDGVAHTVFTDTLHPEDEDGDDVEYTDLVKAYDEPPINYPEPVKFVYADNTDKGENNDWDLYHWTPATTSQFRYKLQVKIPENVDETKMDSFVLKDALQTGADIVSLDGITLKEFGENSEEAEADETWFQEDQNLTGFTTIPVTIAFDDGNDADGTRQAAINAAAGANGKLVIGLDEVTFNTSGSETTTDKHRVASQEADGSPLGTTFDTWPVYTEYHLSRYNGENELDADDPDHGDDLLYDDAMPATEGGLWGSVEAFIYDSDMRALAPEDSPMSGNPQYIVYQDVSSTDGSGGTIAGYLDYITEPDNGNDGSIVLFGNGGASATLTTGDIRIVPVEGETLDDTPRLVNVPTDTEGVSKNSTYSIAPPELDGYTWTVSRKGRSVTVTYSKAGGETDASSKFTASTSGDVLTLTATGDVSELEGKMLYVYMTCRWNENEAKSAGHYTSYAQDSQSGLRYYHLNDFGISTTYRSGHKFSKKSNEVKVETWKAFTLPTYTLKKYITEGGTDYKAADDNDPESYPYVYGWHPDGVPYRIDADISNLSDSIAAFSSFTIMDTFVDALEITGATAIVNGTRMPWTQEEFGDEKTILGMPFILEVTGQDIMLSAPSGLPTSAYGNRVSLEVTTHIRDDNGADPFNDPYSYDGFINYVNKKYRITNGYHTEISFPNISRANAMFGKTPDGDRIGQPIDRTSNEVWAKFQYDFKLDVDKTEADSDNPDTPEDDAVRVPGAEFLIYPFDDEKGEYAEEPAAALAWDGTAKKYVMADDKWIYKTENNRNGKFLLEEYVTPEGYKQAPDQEFTLTPGSDGIIHLNVVEELACMNMRIYKIDESTVDESVPDRPLGGAVYAVRAREDIVSATQDDEALNLFYESGDIIDTITTGPDGYAQSNKDYYPGKYYVEEVTPPPGYELDTEPHYFEITTDTRNPNLNGVTLWYAPSNKVEDYEDTNGLVSVSDRSSVVKVKIKKTIDKIQDVRWPESGRITFDFLIKGTAKSGEKINLQRSITFLKDDYTGRTGPVTIEKEITDLPIGDYKVIELKRRQFKLGSLTAEVNAAPNTATKAYSPTRGVTETAIPAQETFSGNIAVKFYDESATGRPASVNVKVYHPKAGGGSEVYATAAIPINASGEGTGTVTITGGSLANAWIQPDAVSGYKWYYVHNSSNGYEVAYVADNSEFGSISAEDEYAVFDLSVGDAVGTATFTNTKRNDEWYLHVKKANADGNPLQNAHFSIFSDNALTRLVSSGKTNATGEYVSPLLQEGVYYLEETKSAAGYSLLANAVEISAESGSTALTLRINGELVGSDTTKPIYAVLDSEGYYHLYLNVTNQKGFTLPMTGAPLQIWLIVIIVGITAVSTAVIRKKKKKKA